MKILAFFQFSDIICLSMQYSEKIPILLKIARYFSGYASGFWHPFLCLLDIGQAAGYFLELKTPGIFGNMNEADRRHMMNMIVDNK